MKFAVFILSFLLTLSVPLNGFSATCTCQCQVIPDPIPTPPIGIPEPPLEPPQGSCRIGTPLPRQSLHRGLYLSLQSSTIGVYALPSNLKNLLGDLNKENELLRFAVARNIDSLSYYDLHKVLASASLSEKLSQFIQAAKNCGISEHVAIGSVSEDWAKIKAFGKFQAALTEIEFWNEPDLVGAFSAYLKDLRAIKSLGLKAYTYIGWINRIPGKTEQQVANEIAPLIDRLMPHCYVRDANIAYPYCASRIQAFRKAKPELPIYPIFSAESPTAKAGYEVFMGDWLRLNGMKKAESLFSEEYLPAGFYYYDYAFLSANQ